MAAQSCCYNEAFIKHHQGWGSEGCHVGASVENGENGVPRKHIEVPFFPIPCSTHTFHVAVPGLCEIHPFIINL